MNMLFDNWVNAFRCIFFIQHTHFNGMFNICMYTLFWCFHPNWHYKNIQSQNQKNMRFFSWWYYAKKGFLINYVLTRPWFSTLFTLESQHVFENNTCRNIICKLQGADVDAIFGPWQTQHFFCCANHVFKQILIYACP